MYEGLCADCLHTRCSDYKHPNDLGLEKYISAEEAKALEEVEECRSYRRE